MANRNKKITFNKPFIVGKELYYIAQAVTVNSHISGNGEFTKQCQLWLEKTLHTRRALLTHSCTAALEMAAILCDIQPGDEVIMPSYTFVSTANAFVLRGGVPVFVDIRPDTLNIDESKIADAITNKTKAIVPVHYAGIPCAMDEILHIGDKNNLMVVEDAAQAYLSKQGDNYLGSIGHLGCLSFHETKNIISGEGGALLINDERFIERAEIIWEKGTDRGQFFRGEVDKYSWMDMGSSYQPGELISAFLYAQLEHAEKIIASRSHSFQLYYEGLKDLQDEGLIRLPHLQKGSTGNGHIFFIMTGSADESDQLMQHLNEKQIMAIHHYVPLHSSRAGIKYGRASGSMTETDEMSQRIVRMPLYYDMEEADISRIIKEVKLFYGQ